MTCNSYDNGGYKVLYNLQPKHYKGINLDGCVLELTQNSKLMSWLKNKLFIIFSRFLSAACNNEMDVTGCVAIQRKFMRILVEFVVMG